MELLQRWFQLSASTEDPTRSKEDELLDAQLALQDAFNAHDHDEQQRLARHIRQKFFATPAWTDVEAPLKSRQPVVVCIAYPRSGLTFSISIISRMLGGAHTFTALPHSTLPFDKRWYPEDYPKARVIKDHRALSCYRPDHCANIIRDGRDCMASLAWMTLEDKRHSFKLRTEMKDFIRWTDTSYQFGSWASHTKDLLDLANYESNKKTLFFYETFRKAAVLEPDKGLQSGNAALQRTSSDLGMKSETKALWGVGVELPPNSMFEAWQANRGGTNWCATFDREAALAFHETGATEQLIRLGYETDEDWWRQF